MKIAIVVLAAAAAAQAQLNVTGVSPSSNALSAGRETSISVTFDQAVDTGTVTTASFWAFGRWTGPAEGVISFSDADQTITLTPDDPFTAGDLVTVILSHDIQAADGTPLREAGYSFQFWTASGPGNLEFEHIQTLEAFAFPNEPVRSYGGHAADLDNDGFLDLTIVNEDSEDLRVFMNLAAGDGIFDDDFMTPPNQVGNRASPNEPADFNRDGFTDVCVANITDGTVSVLLGNGDGSYAPQQLIDVGNAPRGIAVLDADGDGDLDICNTNSQSGNMSIMINDGNGVFGDPSFWEGGASGEWALSSADMNHDGILDLVVGANSGQQIVVNIGNGDGTFTPSTPQSSGGSVWMISVGDVDADGDVDVACANSTTNNATIVRGNGDGTLMPPEFVSPDPFALATDLGDMDGDGDLDWVLSSFAGDWTFWVNDGAGNFSFKEELPAPNAASCALMLDIDNDNDLDLALIDELADVIEIHEQVCRADVNGDGVLNILDFVAFQGLFQAGDAGADCDANGELNVLDFVCYQALFQAGCSAP